MVGVPGVEDKSILNNNFYCVHVINTRGRGAGDRRKVNPKNSFYCVHVMNTRGRGGGGRRQVNPKQYFLLCTRDGYTDGGRRQVNPKKKIVFTVYT